MEHDSSPLQLAVRELFSAPGRHPARGHSKSWLNMATISDIVCNFLQESPASGENNNEQSGDPSCSRPPYDESLEQEGTESDLGKVKPVRKRE